MFTTYRSAEIHLDTAKGTTAQLWSYVEQEISWPWFYLQIARRHGRQAYRSMLMLNHAHDLKRSLMISRIWPGWRKCSWSHRHTSMATQRG